MTKSVYRELYKEKRNQFSAVQSEELSFRVFEQLKAMNIWGNTYFHVFVSMLSRNEINTRPLIDFLFEQNKTVIVPKMSKNELLNCKINSDTQWKLAKFGVPEPENYELIDSKLIEVVFVPLLICDEKGNRIGYGGGYYDRFLAGVNRDCLIIGLNFFPPVQQIEGLEITDIPLDYLVTPDEIVSFTS